MDERLKRQLDFAVEIDKEKNILRQTHLSEHGRRENDAEHAWHMAIMAYLFREHSNESVDIAKVMLMCLIHDIVEIEAGDTYAYDEEGLKSQKEREERAKEKLYYGYWSFEAGAIAKILNLDDSNLKDVPYYPYDLVHYKSNEKFSVKAIETVEENRREDEAGEASQTKSVFKASRIVFPCKTSAAIAAE